MFHHPMVQIVEKALSKRTQMTYRNFRYCHKPSDNKIILKSGQNNITEDDVGSEGVSAGAGTRA